MSVSQAFEMRQPVASTAAADSHLNLRELAALADSAASHELHLAPIWSHLVDGDYVIADEFFTKSRCGLVLAPRRRGCGPALWGRRLELLQAILCGAGQKRVALENRLAPSTVALHARLGLESLGILCRPSRVHPLLMLAASVAVQPAGPPAGLGSTIDWQGITCLVVGIPRPEMVLQGQFPRAELEVVQRLVEGKCYADISSGRGTSTRTTANQLAAAFRRLRVSGRADLLQRLFVLAGWLPEPSATLAPPSSSRCSRESDIRRLSALPTALGQPAALRRPA